jgi:hypothetical protein
MNGLYKVTLKTREGQSRQEAIFDYFPTTVFETVEQLTEDIDSPEYFEALGSWTKNVFDKFWGDTFEVMFEMDDDWLTRYWFIDSDNTIKQEFIPKD